MPVLTRLLRFLSPALLFLPTAIPALAADPPANLASLASPSGQVMPLGDIPHWRQVFADDFTQPVPLGSFPKAVGSRWDAYQDGWHDTSRNGTYMPSQVLSQHDGLLDMYIHSAGGQHLVSAPVPKIPGAPGKEGGLLYGRYAVRFKADPVPGYKTAWLLWPDSETWPNDGEIDFPEGNLGEQMCGFVHPQGGRSGRDQSVYCNGTTYTDWHTAVTEWTPSGVTFYLDGQVMGQATSRIPNTPMHLVLQTETNLDGYAPSPDAAGHVLIDWVAVYTPA
jgi:beta-glucanase (GH16 family)